MRKGQFRAIFVFGFLAIFSIVAAPRLPELMAITGMAVGAEPIQELELGAPSVENPELTNDSLVFELSMNAENPNQFPARVYGINYTAYNNGSKIGADSIEADTAIPADSEREINTSITTDSFDAGNETLDIQVDGEIYADIGPARLRIPFETEN